MKVIGTAENGMGKILECSEEEFSELKKLADVLDGRMLTETYRFQQETPMIGIDLSRGFKAMRIWVEMKNMSSQLRNMAHNIDLAIGLKDSSS